MKYFFTYIALFLNLLVYSQKEEVELTLHLKNGDILTGISPLRTINFNTEFGDLAFPIDQVNSINVGLQDSEFDKGNLLTLLEDIEFGSDAKKVTAFDKIVQMEEGAIPFINAYLKSSEDKINDSDISVQTLYEVMLAKHKVDRNYSIKDILTYKDNYKVEGNYSFNEIVIDTEYGRLRLERSDIDLISVKIVSEGLENSKVLKLYANQHISGNKDGGWLNTGIKKKKGEQFSISASGQVVLASLSGNTYASDGGVNGSAGPIGNKTQYGQVVYKIGQNGTVKKAGDDLETVASNTGIIYISIYESVFNSANAGYYTVELKVD